MASLRSPRGQSVIEILIALALLGILASASFILLSTAFSEGRFAQERAIAEQILAEGMEATRQIRDRNFDDLAAGTYGLARTGADWAFSGTEDVTDGRYQRTVTVTELDENQREIIVSVTWTPRLGRTQVLETATLLADVPQVAVPPSSNCYGFELTGDWSNPTSLGTGDLGPGNQGTDVVVDYPYAFVSGVAASSAKPDLFAFDASDPTLPTLIDEIDVGANGINAIARNGDILVAASSNDSREFMVFDVSDPTNMQLVGSSNLTGSEDGLSVLLINDLAVLARANSATAEIYFYDVSTPATPSLLGSHEVGADVHDFASNETYLFAVTSSETSDIVTFDVSAPLSPTYVGDFDLLDDSEDLSLSYHVPDLLFVGNASNEFIVVDASDPLNLVEVSSVTTGGQVKDVVCVTGQLLVTGTDNPNQESILLDITALPTVSTFTSLNFPQEANGVDFAENMVFVAVRSNDALRILTGGTP